MATKDLDKTPYFTADYDPERDGYATITQEKIVSWFNRPAENSRTKPFKDIESGLKLKGEQESEYIFEDAADLYGLENDLNKDIDKTRLDILLGTRKFSVDNNRIFKRHVLEGIIVDAYRNEEGEILSLKVNKDLIGTN